MSILTRSSCGLEKERAEREKDEKGKTKDITKFLVTVGIFRRSFFVAFFAAVLFYSAGQNVKIVI